MHGLRRDLRARGEPYHKAAEKVADVLAVLMVREDVPGVDLDKLDTIWRSGLRLLRLLLTRELPEQRRMTVVRVDRRSPEIIVCKMTPGQLAALEANSSTAVVLDIAGLPLVSLMGL